MSVVPVRSCEPRWSPLGALVALVRGLVSLAVLAGLALGVPASLVRHVGRPWPVEVPPLVELRRRIETGEVRGMVIVALAALVWLAWLRLMVAVFVEVVRRGVHRARGSSPSAVNAVAAGLVTGIGLLAVVLPSRSAAARPPATAIVPAERTVPVGESAPAVELRREPGLLDGLRSTPFLAAGAVGALEVARRRHLRSAPAGSGVPPLPDALARLEAGLRSAAPAETRDRLGELAALWVAAARHAAPAVPVAALVGSSADDLTVLFAEVAPAPPPGWVTAGPDRWRPRGGARPPIEAAASPVALLPVGRCAGADLYLDLAVTGPVRVEAAAPVAERVERALQAAAELSPLDWPAGLAAVAADPDRPGVRLIATGGRWRLEPFGIVLEPFGLEHPDLDSVRALLAAVADPPAADPPATARSPQAGWSVPAPAATGWSFLVRVLGPLDVIGIDGRAVEFERSKAEELVAWLVLHRRRAGREAARTALWDQDVRDTTFANVVSEARRALNRHLVPGDGGDWLGRPTGEQLPLHPEVWCDVEVFEHWVAAARRRPGTPEAIAALRQALDLVRGVPLTGAPFAWADAEGLTSSLTLMVVAAAAELADAHLGAGDVDGAFAATAVGLRLVPGHEELVALRLRAHAERGDLAGVRHEWAAYERTLAADRWQPAASPRLVALCTTLLAPVVAGG